MFVTSGQGFVRCEKTHRFASIYGFGCQLNRVFEVIRFSGNHQAGRSVGKDDVSVSIFLAVQLILKPSGVICGILAFNFSHRQAG